jgi:hypothetical protein
MCIVRPSSKLRKSSLLTHLTNSTTVLVLLRLLKCCAVRDLRCAESFKSGSLTLDLDLHHPLISSVRIIMLTVIIPAVVAFDIGQGTATIQVSLEDHFHIVYSQGFGLLRSVSCRHRCEPKHLSIVLIKIDPPPSESDILFSRVSLSSTTRSYKPPSISV